MTTRTDIGTLRGTNIGFLLAKACQRWNGLLADEFRGERSRRRPGVVWVGADPAVREDGLRTGERAARSHLAKQTMTTMVRVVEGAAFVERRPDPDDAPATRVYLTNRGHRLRLVPAREVARLEQLIEKHIGARRAAALRASLAEVVAL